MSYFGKWKCPACGNEWVGSIGWTMPKDLPGFLEKMCGCTGKVVGREESAGMISMSCCSGKINPKFEGEAMTLITKELIKEAFTPKEEPVAQPQEEKAQQAEGKS